MLVKPLVASVYWDLLLLALFLPPQVVPYPGGWLREQEATHLLTLCSTVVALGELSRVWSEIGQMCGEKKTLDRLNNSLGKSS
jgi:hypothetical protein